MPTLLAIDPGSVHNGMAEFSTHQGAWSCVNAWELGPIDCEQYVAETLRDDLYQAVVIEQFTLYPDKAMQQSGSTFGECERIGVVKYLCRQYGVRLVLQPASIQEPMKGLLRKRGIKSTAKKLKAGPHALSAELHGFKAIEGGCLR